MSNQILVPRNDSEGGLGTSIKRWGNAHFTSASIDNLTATIVDQNYSGDFDGTFTGSFLGGSFRGDTLNIGNDISSIHQLTGSLNVSGTIDNLTYLTFDTSRDELPTLGELSWNTTDGTLDLGLGGDVTLQMGQEVLYPYVVNGDTVDLINGTLVMVIPGDVVQGQRLKVRRAITTGEYAADLLIGVTSETITTGQTGFVTWFGYTRNVSITELESVNQKNPSQTWSEGDLLYPDAERPGGLTNTLPTADNLKSTIGVITKISGKNITILVRPNFGTRLQDIHDVHATPSKQGSLLSYNVSSSIWNSTNELSGSYELTGSLDVDGSITGSFEGVFGGDGTDLYNVKSVQHRVNSVTVNEKSDFPAPTGSIITLKENTEYFINGTVNIGTDRIYYNTGSYIGGLNIQADKIYYIGTGSAVNSHNAGQIVGKHFSIIAPSGSAIDLRQDDVITHLNYDYIGFVGCDKIGTISGYDVATLKSCAQVPIIGIPTGEVKSGIRFTGTQNKIFIDSCVFQNESGSDYSIYFDENNSSDTVDITNTYFKSDEQTTIKVHPSSSITEGRLLSNIFRGEKSNGPLTGFNESTIGWEFIANTSVTDTIVAFSYYIDDNDGGLTTTINAVNTPVKVNAITSTQFPNQGKFESSTVNNRAIYKGLKPQIMELSANMTIESTANSQIFDIYWYKNGIKIPGSRSQIGVQQSGVRLNVSSKAAISLSTDDYVELWIQNSTSTADVIIHTLSGFGRR